MGSIHSMPLPTTPPLLREFNPSSYRVYASFCPKEQGVSNQLECYDPSNNKSGHVCPIPEIIDNHVLMDLPCDFVDFSVEVSPVVLRCNVRSGQWSKCAPLGIPRYEFACTVCDNEIYVAVGKSDLASGRGISSAEMYDPAVDMWTPLPNMSTMRLQVWRGDMARENPRGKRVCGKKGIGLDDYAHQGAELR
ncbi:hypothetical protein SLEP1_g52907 [Rubroshorea leprosula]|uniref:Uncharacterized protein n=1 Tax=Rubroshorea leprosula TaxID=152421 RepID=A0AAV5M7S0_9ROSI|nr:hypothetical protein SLEP1_g52907 [Rubroshorea leprosula]